MSNPSQYGYGNKLSTDDVPTHFGTDPTPPPFDPARHNPPGTDFGYPAGYPSAAGPIYPGDTPTAAETGMTQVSGESEEGA